MATLFSHLGSLLKAHGGLAIGTRWVRDKYDGDAASGFYGCIYVGIHVG